MKDTPQILAECMLNMFLSISAPPGIFMPPMILSLSFSLLFLSSPLLLPKAHGPLTDIKNGLTLSGFILLFCSFNWYLWSGNVISKFLYFPLWFFKTKSYCTHCPPYTSVQWVWVIAETGLIKVREETPKLCLWRISWK